MTTTTEARPQPPAATHAWPRWVPPALVAMVFLLIAGPLGSAGGKLSDVQRNDSTQYLPTSAEATAATGSVITSAGVVLAATFAALAVLPLLVLAELAFAVAFGVLLDALVVRTLLVPALTVDLGRVVWWPGPLRRAEP